MKASPVGKRRLAEPDSDSDYIESDDDDDEEEEEEGEGTSRSKEMLNPELLAEQGLIRPLKKKVINAFIIVPNHTLLPFNIKSIMHCC